MHKYALPAHVQRCTRTGLRRLAGRHQKRRAGSYDQCPGQMVMVKVPTQWDNIKFFFIYQFELHVLRYFMWNLPGRQNDIVRQGEIERLAGLPEYRLWTSSGGRPKPAPLRPEKQQRAQCIPIACR